MMATLDVLLDQKKENIKAVLDKYGASNLRVYGSVARREDTENSDINFLADIPTGTLHSRVMLIEDLQKDLGDFLGKKEIRVNDLVIGAMWDQVNAEAILIC